MIVQCITKKATGLPVTLFEVHTAIHVLRALIIYLFWWHKPQDISEPFVLLEDIAVACFYALESAGFKVELNKKEDTILNREHGESCPTAGGSLEILKRSNDTIAYQRRLYTTKRRVGRDQHFE